ncbi:prepilin-type N-terminal cleavage/methylation domain-containing protein [Blastopirellula sp. JC732]|uniref:Prepilin-type N-terminal cleavage/methylation domain-containing protein n=1 Tax=Blastopirellula sediminis TaxID=2894196 RepID=A0A9X1MU67_9BACT|nr:prepilin-type N-terminal cleavage/methylation domain-containing protein [Blastopirellula sediminis]MCC9604549.1 prepilin-type N-terminal cleavage/methylation domain-containing protein [Blastopirellula sediminis]MCC9632152.1 prepilin-type N-terminal cleavage/methylation domain-containing protein [Blastopirellula sediminis]
MRSTALKRGFTLIELLLVVALISIVTAVVLPQLAPTFDQQLRGCGEIVVSDLDYARSLAIANGSTYRITFDDAANTYTLTHVGTNATLDTLPRSPFHNNEANRKQQVTSLSDLPHVGVSVTILGAVVTGNTDTRTTFVEFGPLGETTATKPTIIWLRAGSGVDSKYAAVRIHPITGVATLEDPTQTPPDIPAS